MERLCFVMLCGVSYVRIQMSARNKIGCEQEQS